MSTFFADFAMSAAFRIVVRASVLLGVAAIAQAVWHARVSAATRHLVWTLAIAGLLLLPILSLALPDWPVVIRTAAPTTLDVAATTNRVEEPADVGRPSATLTIPGDVAPIAPIAQPAVSPSWPAVIAGVYAAGVLVMLMVLAMQWRSVRRLALEASNVQDAEWTRLFAACVGRMGVDRPVRLLRSRERSMPMALGIRRPAILIPAIADTWSDDRRRAVILHELAHVARYDCLTQALAFAACALYWFHPAAWWVARRLRIERELACDDRVIAAGTEAREYAGHLLDIAYGFGHFRAPALAVSMARPRQLEGRLLAALDAARNRSVPAVRVRAAGVAIAVALLLPLASLTTKVVAADSGADRVSAVEAPQHDLKAAPWNAGVASLRESARAVIRAAAAAVGIAQDGLPGTWEIRPTSTAGIVHLRLVELNSSSGSDIPIERLEGLTAAQLTGPGGPIQFRLRRDAGTFTFEGVLRGGVAAGTFSFAPDPNFPKELAKRGFAAPTASEQYQLARHDVGYAFLDELTRQGYAKPATSELVRAGQHGVDTTYLHDMGALGYRLGSLEPLITLRDHGVTTAYVRDLAGLGYKGLPADDLRQARDHGVTPEFVRGMREAGYSSLTMEQLIRARDHGVTPEYVRALTDAGYAKLPLDQLIRVRDHGVTPEYVRAMREAGYGSLPMDALVNARDHGIDQEYVRGMREAGYGSLALDALVNARDHGVDVEFVRGMAALGYASVPIESLVRLRDHGVTPKYAQELKALGYDRMTIDDLVTLRDHGLTADRIRAANAHAGTRLSIDMLKSLATGGMR